MTSTPTRWVKICGVTRVEDAELAVEAGASALGLNFVPSSKRYIELGVAREIAAAVRGRVELVGVFANESAARLAQIANEVGLDRLQLHDAESADFVRSVPGSFKALGVATAADVAAALTFPGELLLLDAKVEGESGGTGRSFDWALIDGVTEQRKLVLAGGLTPENVAQAVARVRPFGVDVASGVEVSGDPRRKDPDRVRRFVGAARGE